MRSQRFAALVGTIGAGFALLTLAVGSAIAAPYHQFVPHRFAQPPTTADCESQSGIACYQPFQLQQAYDMNPLYKAGLTGKGKTIVIVDALRLTERSRAIWRRSTQSFNLPAPPSFKIIQPAGAVPAVRPDQL